MDATSSLQSEVLPVPEGADTTNKNPCRRRAGMTLFDILNLLTNLLKLGFHGKNLLRDGEIADLRPDGRHLAIDFLQQKIQTSADRLRLPKKIPELPQMAFQAGHLLAHIATISQQGDFLRDTSRIQRRMSRSFQQAIQPSLEPGEGFLYDDRKPFPNRRYPLLNL